MRGVSQIAARAGRIEAGRDARSARLTGEIAREKEKSS